MILLLALLYFLGASAAPTENLLNFKVDHYSWLDNTTDEIVIKPTLKIPIRGKDVEFQVIVSHDGPTYDDHLTAKVVANFSSSVAPKPTRVSGMVSLLGSKGVGSYSDEFDHIFTPENNTTRLLILEYRENIMKSDYYDRENDCIYMRIIAYLGPLGGSW